MIRNLLLSLILVIVACNSSNKVQTRKSAPRIQILSSKGMISYEVELAKTNSQRQLGLMNRESLADRHGMIFFFDNDEDHVFWMKNTLIPLDIVFFDKDWMVVGFFEGMKPLSLEGVSIKKASRYALEINAGLIKKDGIAISDKAVLFERD